MFVCFFSKYTLLFGVFQASGVKVADACKAAFTELKLGKDKKDSLRYVIFALSPDMKEIVVLKKAPRGTEYSVY